MAAEGYADSILRPTLAVGGGGVEVVYPMLYGCVDKAVYLLLVDEVFPGVVKVGFGGPTHAAVAQQRDLVAGRGIDPEGHPVGRNRGLGQLAFVGVSIFLARTGCQQGGGGEGRQGGLAEEIAA